MTKGDIKAVYNNILINATCQPFFEDWLIFFAFLAFLLNFDNIYAKIFQEGTLGCVALIFGLNARPKPPILATAYRRIK